MNPAPPFSAWERSIALRYLRSRRSQGGVALISIISFVAIALSVATLIIVMSIMNGFTSELTAKILGFNGHAYIVGGAMTPAERDAMVARVRAVPGVVEAAPVVESQALVQGPNAAAGAIVRGVEPADLRATPMVVDNIKAGSAANFGRGEDGGDVVLVGQKLAETLG
ncbi:MAG TPA: ABC transporter permease, partial [Caulobacteraceae bacterium]|nr:ABC transporter permease [Caulobacteraceae bacterium]